MMDKNSKINEYLGRLSSFPRELVPFWNADGEELRSLTGIYPDKVINQKDGGIAIMYFHKERTVEKIKQLYNFKTKEEAAEEIQEVMEQENASGDSL